MDKGRLLEDRLPRKQVATPVGDVTVRSLSRGEVIRMQALGDDYDVIETQILRWGIVDPHLTEDEVKAWRDIASPEEIEPVINTIMELSGLIEEASKSG